MSAAGNGLDCLRQRTGGPCPPCIVRRSRRPMRPAQLTCPQRSAPVNAHACYLVCGRLTAAHTWARRSCWMACGPLTHSSWQHDLAPDRTCLRPDARVILPQALPSAQRTRLKASPVSRMHAGGLSFVPGCPFAGPFAHEIRTTDTCASGRAKRAMAQPQACTP